MMSVMCRQVRRLLVTATTDCVPSIQSAAASFSPDIVNTFPIRHVFPYFVCFFSFRLCSSLLFTQPPLCPLTIGFSFKQHSLTISSRSPVLAFTVHCSRLSATLGKRTPSCVLSRCHEIIRALFANIVLPRNKCPSPFTRLSSPVTGCMTMSL